MNFCFGRGEHDPIALAAAPAHRFGTRIAAPVVDRRGVPYQPNLYRNDQYGDCTCVAMANYARGVAALNGFDIGVTDNEVLGLFGAVGGTDNYDAIPGLVALDVLAYQQRQGFAITNDKLVANFGTVNIERNALSNAIERFGGSYLGVRLYQRDLDTYGATWDAVDGRDDGALVGRHMIHGWDYDTARVRVSTWGTLQPATWSWVLNRLDEAYALVWRQLARADGTFYDGINADGLMTAL